MYRFLQDWKSFKKGEEFYTSLGVNYFVVYNHEKSEELKTIGGVDLWYRSEGLTWEKIDNAIKSTE